MMDFVWIVERSDVVGKAEGLPDFGSEFMGVYTTPEKAKAAQKRRLKRQERLNARVGQPLHYRYFVYRASVDNISRKGAPEPMDIPWIGVSSIEVTRMRIEWWEAQSPTTEENRIKGREHNLKRLSGVLAAYQARALEQFGDDYTEDERERLALTASRMGVHEF